VANEHWQNGLENVEELRALGSRLAARTSTLVALSSPFPGEVCELYAKSDVDLATIHYGRAKDPWAAVRQPWAWPDDDVPCRDSLPVLINNEPMGPQSSVQSDVDPARLAMAYVMTFLSGNAAYVLHTGAGVRGGGAADRALGRASDLSATPDLERTLAAMSAARSYLPADLANWTRRERDDPQHPLGSTDTGGGESDSFFVATSENRFVALVLEGSATVVARAPGPVTVQVHHPLTGVVLTSDELAEGEPLRLDGADAYVLTGTVR
jgi:hypothetical protein